jgi:hypothetical protein
LKEFKDRLGKIKEEKTAKKAPLTARYDDKVDEHCSLKFPREFALKTPSYRYPDRVWLRMSITLREQTRWKRKWT